MSFDLGVRTVSALIREGVLIRNDAQRGATEECPRRSDDFHDRRLFDRPDEVEREVVLLAGTLVRPGRTGGIDREGPLGSNDHDNSRS